MLLSTAQTAQAGLAQGWILPSGWLSVSVSKWWRRNFSCSGVWGREPLAKPGPSGLEDSSLAPEHPGRGIGREGQGTQKLSTP